MDSLKAFQRSLAETITWCAPRAESLNPALSLRSVPLSARPPIVSRTFDKWRASVAAVAVARAELLRHAGNFPQAPATDLAGGRLLLFAPDESLSDGAAEVYSASFFDADNVPPWDTWVDYVEYTDGSLTESSNLPVQVFYLVCWVPPHLIDLAEAGICANPEGCIEWLSGRDILLTRTLREIGLLA